MLHSLQTRHSDLQQTHTHTHTHTHTYACMHEHTQPDTNNHRETSITNPLSLRQNFALKQCDLNVLTTYFLLYFEGGSFIFVQSSFCCFLFVFLQREKKREQILTVSAALL